VNRPFRAPAPNRLSVGDFTYVATWRGNARVAQVQFAVSKPWTGTVGSVGDSYDDALAETVIAPFETEVIRPRGPWRSLEAVEFAPLERADWFDHRRLLEPIGNVPPAEAEAACSDAPETAGLAAWKPTKSPPGFFGSFMLAGRTASRELPE
jgi:transposase InsO family protein